MPVTAKLSRNFYEKLGDDIANELVEWFNSVDASYRSELREIVTSDGRTTRAELRQEMAAQRAELRQEIAAVRVELKSEIGALRAELIKWSFVFFATAALAVIGLQ